MRKTQVTSWHPPDFQDGKLSTKSQVFRPEALVTYAYALTGIKQVILKLPFLEEPWGKVLKIENQRKDYVVGYELGQGKSVFT